MRLAAGLRLDPLGELQLSPRPPSRNWGVLTSKGKGRGKGKEADRGKKGRERQRKKVREGKGAFPPVTTTFWCKVAPLS